MSFLEMTRLKPSLDRTFRRRRSKHLAPNHVLVRDEDKAPEFDRLTATARVAFVQDAYKVIKTGTEIENEVKERFVVGEAMPPKAH